MNQLDELEAKALYAIRESIESNKKTVFILSANKNSIVLFHLIRKACAPHSFPIPVLINKKLNPFSEINEYQKNLIHKYDLTLLKPDAINLNFYLFFSEQNLFNYLILSQQKSEEKNSVHDFWDLSNNQRNEFEHTHINPLSSWTELEQWEYIKRENLEVPSTYFSHSRLCLKNKEGRLIAMSPYVQKKMGEVLVILNVRFETINDQTNTYVIESNAQNITELIKEIKINLSSENENATCFEKSSAVHSIFYKKAGI